MSSHFLANLKAYAALVGLIATALLAQHTSGAAGVILTDVAAVATVVGVWAVPNKAPQEPAKAPSGDVQAPTE